jgi:SAM-dependent methyltransferase
MQPGLLGSKIRRAAERGELPSYAPRMAAFHRSCAVELKTIVSHVPLIPGQSVLDLACGDGFYLGWLAERVGRDGHVVGADLSERYLALAETRVAEARLGGAPIELSRADVRRLPFDDKSFDVVWCAHSLYSLPDPDQALAEMRRVTRPGGVVAVLENDSLHYLLMPWPPELELAVQQAQLLAARAEHSKRKLYIGRRLPSALLRAGLEGYRVKTFSIDHQAPLDDDERTFLADYLRELAERTRPFLEPDARAAFEQAISPEGDGYLLDRSDCFITQLEILAWAREPR